MGIFKRTEDAKVIELKRGSQEGDRFGQPTQCPSCAGAGFLDHIDLIDRVMDQHCTDCGYQWQTAESDMQYHYFT